MKLRARVAILLICIVSGDADASTFEGALAARANKRTPNWPSGWIRFDKQNQDDSNFAATLANLHQCKTSAKNKH